MGTNDDRPILRSINNRHSSAVRFINTTRYRVEILWINYEGQAVSYGVLESGNSLGISTYATHPWIFVGTETMDRFIANGKDVFYPEPWFGTNRALLRSERPRQMSPTLVYITIPMYSLREISMKRIKSLLLNDNDAYLLDIPKNLQRELASMLPRQNRA